LVVRRVMNPTSGMRRAMTKGADDDGD